MPPVGPPALPQDNLLIGDRSLTYRDTGQTHRIAVAYSGSAQITADLYIYEEATGGWYRISTAPVVLPANAITFFDVAVPLSTAERLQGDNTKPGGELQCVLVPHNPGGLADGEFKFAMAPNLSEPSGGGGGGGPSSNVNIISPIPLPVIFSLPSTTWTPGTVGSLTASLVIKAVPGVFYEAFGFNSKNTHRYLMLFDSAALPVNGTPAWICIDVPNSGSFSISLERPRRFTIGPSLSTNCVPTGLN